MQFNVRYATVTTIMLIYTGRICALSWSSCEKTINIINGLTRYALKNGFKKKYSEIFRSRNIFTQKGNHRNDDLKIFVEKRKKHKIFYFVKILYPLSFSIIFFIDE